EDILVENCRIKSRCNAIKFGTETNGGFSNILMRNIEIFDSRITGISVESVDGAHIDHLHFENITMENVGTPFFVHLGKRMRGPSHLTIGSIRDVSFKNITAKGPYQLYHCLPWNYDSFLRKDTIQFPGFYSKDKVEAPGTWQITSNVCGLINHPLKNITFENITLELDGGVSSFETKVRDEPQPYPEVNTYGRYLPAAAIYFRDVAGLKLKNIQVKLIHDDARPLFVFDRVEDLIRV
ncbi:MAG: hypothetical protein GX638_17500, partial [Crenarchaeota archaeon]|nr:hypothetical protein [Thermoproteota archaeon]